MYNLVILRGNSGSGKSSAAKDKRFESGEAEMRRRWKEKDFIGIIPERIFREEVSLEEAGDMIYQDINDYP